MIFPQAQELWRLRPLIERGRFRRVKWISNPLSQWYQDDLATARRCKELGVELVVRVADFSLTQDHDGVDAEAEARRFLAHVEAQVWHAEGLATWIETPNEPFPSFACPPWYMDFQWWVQSYSAVPVVLHNFGTRQPVPPPPAGAEVGCIGVHFYWWQYGPHAWGLPELLAEVEGLLRRYLNLTVMLTEAGRTRALVQPEVAPGEDYDLGWRTAGLFAWQYWEECLTVDRAFAERFGPRYEGMALFGMGMHPGGSGEQGWSSFEVLGTEIEDFMAAQPRLAENVPALRPAPNLTEEGDGMAESMELGPGMAAKAAELGAAMTGAQLTGEQYMKNPDGSNVFSFAVFERGELRYYFPPANVVAWFPFG